MLVDKILEDKQFGHIYIRTNARAVRYTFRPAKDGTPEQGLLVTAPARYSVADVMRSVEENRSRLEEMLRKSVSSAQEGEMLPHIDWSFSIQSDCLHITLVKGISQSFFLRHEQAELRSDGHGFVEVISPAKMQVVCPQDCDFDADGTQAWLEKVIVEGLRKHAKLQLIQRMQNLALHHGISLSETKINNSKGHWGSCARHKKGAKGIVYFSINLSLYTLLLPLPVQRLILLHELCHTRHMDHSAAFHHDLDVWLGGQEQKLEAELKRFTTTIFSFANVISRPLDD